ncbi:MAG TPA: hypothetical protein VLA14_05245, partial [Polyangia bacterium]|nr:hypothetical protein [Polyangia bacterium]
MSSRARPVRRRGCAWLALLAASSVACQPAAKAPEAPAPTPQAPAPAPRPAVHDAPGPTATPGEGATAAHWLEALRQKGTAAITT